MNINFCSRILLGIFFLLFISCKNTKEKNKAETLENKTFIESNVVEEDSAEDKNIAYRRDGYIIYYKNENGMLYLDMTELYNKLMDEIKIKIFIIFY
jgi:hypothetical protein